MRILNSELHQLFSINKRLADRTQPTIEVIEASQEMTFENPHGVVTAKKGDFIAKDVYGNFYPIDRKTFFKTYRLRGFP